jgi:hypothetical protein
MARGRSSLKALIAASAPMHFLEDTPTAGAAGVGRVTEFEKATLVAKLAAARRRKRRRLRDGAKNRRLACGGRPLRTIPLN